MHLNQNPLDYANYVSDVDLIKDLLDYANYMYTAFWLNQHHWHGPIIKAYKKTPCSVAPPTTPPFSLSYFFLLDLQSF